MTTKVVVHGAGRMAVAHAKVLSRRRDVSVKAVSNRGSERGDRLANALHVPRYAHLEQAIVSEKPDIVLVATAPVDHDDALRCALSHQVSVLCEKPVVASGTHLEEIAQAFAVLNRRLWVNFPLRLCSQVAELRSRVQTSSRDLTRVLITSNYPARASFATRGTADPRMLFGGVIWSQAIHEIDLAVHAIGECHISECVFWGLQQGLRIEDEASYRGISGSGVAMEGAASSSPHLPFCSEVVFQGADTRLRFRRCRDRFRSLTQFRAMKKLLDLRDLYTGRFTPLSAVWEECLESYKHGRPSVLDAASTVATHKTVESLYRAARWATDMTPAGTGILPA